MEAIIVRSLTIPSRQTEKKNEIYRGSEVLTEKSSGTGKSKTNPSHNLPL